jgi:hypothetical protein
MSRIFLVKYGAEYNSEPNWQGCKGKKLFPVSGDNLKNAALGLYRAFLIGRLKLGYERLFAVAADGFWLRMRNILT